VAEEFDNYDALAEEARRIVERWDEQAGERGPQETGETADTRDATDGIQNEQQLKDVQDHIAYWKQTMTVGQSWLGNEQARAEIMRLQRMIDDYQRRRQGQS
jgi:hypothetical protein